MTKANKRLLVVDDDEQIRELLTFDIAQSGYIVDSASDGESGLRKALDNNYDLILLDVMMPKMNGYDVCKNIRLIKPNVPILMLTPFRELHHHFYSKKSSLSNQAPAENLL